MGKSPLHCVWVLVSLALQQRKDKKPREEKSWAESGRGRSCVSLERKQWDMGKEFKEPHPALHPSRAAGAGLTLEQPLLVTLLPCGCRGEAPSRWMCLTQHHEGSRALSLAQHISLLLCRDISMSFPPISAHHKPSELSSSPTTSAECEPKDVPPFPLPLSSQSSWPCSRQICSLWRKPSHPVLPSVLPGEGYPREGQRQDGISLHTLGPLSSHICFHWFLKLFGLFVNCCMSY